MRKEAGEKGRADSRKKKRFESWKNEFWNYALLAALTLFFCWLFAGRFGLGAKVDWLNQHSVFPDYFRRQFYETGQLFPEFAPNIGAGQNMYYFSYYGLFSPVVLISYLFPGVPMELYLLVTSQLSLAVSVLLIYRWLRNRHFSKISSFFAALIFLLAGPMIYHTFKQIMFVNYMPFLCLALLGVDRYFEKKKPGFLLFGVFLMIMTSFYFSVGGMFVLVLYGIYRYVQIKGEKEEKIKFWTFIKDGFFFLCPMAAAVFMSGILLVPTAFTLGGRESVSTEEVSFLSLLLPKLNSELLFYGNYGLGLTTLSLTVLLTGIFSGFQRKTDRYSRGAERVLFWGLGIVLFVPFFCCIFNGGLYVRAKAMIPFLPLLVYCLAWYGDKMKRKEIPFLMAALPYCITLFCLVFLQTNRKASLLPAGCKWFGMELSTFSVLVLEGVLLFGLFLIFWKCQKKILLLAPSALLLFLLPCILSLLPENSYALKANLTTRELYKELKSEEIGEAIQAAVEGMEGFYRTEQQGGVTENLLNINRVWAERQYITSLYSSTYNRAYRKFRSEVFGTEEPYRNFLMQSTSKNPIFQKIMGVRYVVKHSKGTWKLEENPLAASILYGSSRTIQESEYQKLAFPYNQTALAEYVVIPDGQEGKFPMEDVKAHLKGELEEARLEIPAYETKGTQIRKTEDGLEIKTEETYETTALIQLPDRKTEKEAETQMLFLAFRVHNKQKTKDVRISMNGMQNKQSASNHIYRNEKEWFFYGVALKPGADTVTMRFGPGDYEISDVSCFLSESCQGWSSLYEAEFLPDWENTAGNVISGTIQMEEAGYLVSSIPYEEEFTILIDGKEKEKKQVNTAFLGCTLEKGMHQVQIVYHAPGVFLGKLMSAAGCIWALLILFGRRLHSFVKCVIVRMYMGKKEGEKGKI